MRTRILLALLVLFTAGAGAQERLTLATPVTRPTVTEYRVRALTLYLGEGVTTADDRIDIDLDSTTNTGTVDENTQTRRESYGGATANGLIIALNKANLSTRSLQQRIFDRLIADGRIAGTVTGTVQ
jgi:hypothetical protein